jgi:hypothetical protein
MLVARVTFTVSRFLLLLLLLSLCFIRSSLSLIRSVLQVEEESVRCVEKRKRTNRLLVSHIHHHYHQQQRLPMKKKENRRNIWQTQWRKKKDPHLLPTSPFLCCCFFSFYVLLTGERHDYTTYIYIYIYTRLPLLIESVLMAVLTVPFTHISHGCPSKGMNE